MWWECSECGDRVEHDRAPEVCGGCGTAGALVASRSNGALGDIDPDDRRAAWWTLSLERASGRPPPLAP